MSRLPHSQLSSEDFRAHMGAEFFRTAYQLACELGLYYEDNGVYIPRFTHDISIDEAQAYLEHWIHCYYAPNPFTKSLVGLTEPVFLVEELVKFIQNNGNSADLNEALTSIFHDPMGNLDIITNALNNYSKVIHVEDNRAVLTPNFREIMHNMPNRYDKKAFFKNFDTSSDVNQVSSPSTTPSPLHHFLTALRTKPFMLLAGISGTGKSRIVRKLAQATITKDLQGYQGADFTNDRWQLHSPANFELIQVKPNWHNSMDVIGYLSNIPSPHYVFTPFIEFITKAWQHPDVPFFLCLDEMNLAPVEEYFAEFLSAIESRGFEAGDYVTDPLIKPFNSFGEDVANQMLNSLFPNFKASDTDSQLTDLINRFRTKGLSLPQNLIVIGTVNMDETTFSFSRKVLDRAMSIEMNEVNYDSFLSCSTDDDFKAIVKQYGNGVTLNSLLVNRHIEAREVTNDLGDDATKVINYLKRVNALLESTPYKLGYRAANEALIYLRSSQEFGQPDLMAALDNFTLMKILSRIEGDENKLKITDSEADKERLTLSGVNVDSVRQYGDLNVLTALRVLIAQQLGEYYMAHEPPSSPDDDHHEAESTIEAEAPQPAPAKQPQKLKSIKKIDDMLSQLKRDHFVSYWS